jgi:hypothetical protein
MADFVGSTYTINNMEKGIPPMNIASISASPSDGGVKVKITAPTDTIIEDQTVCTIKGYRIILKKGSLPEDENDGTIVEDVTELDKYEKTALQIGDLENGEEYYIAAFPFNDYLLFNRNKANAAKFTPQEYILFGYYDDTEDTNPETKIHYTDMNESYTPARCVATNTGGWTEGSWTEDAAWFIKGNKPFMVKYDGTLDYELNGDNYALKKADGSASDFNNSSYAGNAMATLPTIWVKRWTEGKKKYRQFCNIQLDENFHAYAHTREDGSIEPYTLIPMCAGSLISNKLRSIGNQTQMNTQTGANELTYAKANGDGWSTGYASIKILIWELETLLTRSTNKQDACGYGNYTGGSAASSLSKTGAQPTGGRFYGYGSAVNKPRKFLHCEWQCGAWERIEGWLYVNGRHYIKPYPPYNETGADYIDTGLSMSGTSGSYISAGVLTDYGEMPTVLGGTSDTNYCCGGWYNASQVDHALVDGGCAAGLLCGGAVVVYYLVSNSGWDVSARAYLKTPTTAQASDYED